MTVGETVSDPARPSVLLTVIVAVRVIGPPAPSATSVHVDTPGGSPPMPTVRFGLF